MMRVPTDAHADAPQGAPFIVERHRFAPGSRVEYAQMTLPEGKLLNWPMVYILANDSSAYVGQTTSVVARMGQHGSNEEKRGSAI